MRVDVAWPMGSVRRRMVALVACVLLVTTMAVAASDPAPAVGVCDSVGYAYDAAGRLVGVSDPDGRLAEYRYDEVGNTVGVDNRGTPDLAVLSTSPTGGPPGTSVTISGGCFAPVASDNEVRFDGRAAEVTAASPYRLVATVPDGATTGRVTVSVAGATATSPEPFRVEGSAAAPSIASISPRVVDRGATVTVNGSGFASPPSANVVHVNRTSPEVAAASPGALSLRLPPGGVGSGRVRVRTPHGTAVSDDDLVVAPEPYRAADIAASGRLSPGAPKTLTVAPDGKITVLLFEVAEGGAVRLTYDESTVNGCGLDFAVYDPMGRRSVIPIVCLGEFGEFMTLTGRPSALFGDRLPGTYQLVIATYGNTTGTVRVSATDVPADATQTVTVGGGPRLVRVDTPGQRAAYTFTGTAGQQTDFRFPASLSGKVIVRCPDGTVLFPPADVGRNHVLPAVTLPADGTYRVEFIPRDSGTGWVIVQLGELPPATHVQTTVGDIAAIRTTEPHQAALVEFDGQAGHRLSATFEASSMAPLTRLLAPNGDVVYNWVRTGALLEPLALPQDGRYRLEIEPFFNDVGTFYVQTYDVPADATATAQIGGPPAAVTTTIPGQNSRITFQGTAGQRVSATYPGGTDAPYTRLVGPFGGDPLWSGRAHPGGFSEPVTLPATGTYTIHADGFYADLGTFRVRLHDVPADAEATATIGGPPASVTTTAPGQNARITFSGATGQRVSMTFGGSLRPYLAVHNPDGSTLWSGGVAPWTFVEPRTLPADGTYTVLVDPSYADVGTFEIRLHDVPPDATGTVTVGGPPVTVTTTVPGQNASVRLDATAGQTVTIVCEYPTGSFTASVRRPDGSELARRGSGFGHVVTFANLVLPVDGAYQIQLDPDHVGTGSLTVTVTGPGAAPPAPEPVAPQPVAAQPGGTGPALNTESERVAELASEDPAESWVPDRANTSGMGWESHRGDEPAAAEPLRDRAGRTAVSGRVLALSGRPLPNVTLRADGRSTRTDAQGRFLLGGLRPGHHELEIDGRTASRPGREFGVYEVGVDLVKGRTLVLPYTIWMTRLDTANAVSFPSPTTGETVLTTPRIPGFEVRLPAGSVVKDGDGNVVTSLSITAIPVDRPPFPLPRGVNTPVYFTVQPGGTYVFPKGAQIVYPNSTGLAPGTVVDFWDHDAGEKGWHIYGRGRVTPDGTQIMPDPDVRVYEFTGSMINVWGLIPALLGLLDEPIFGGDPVELGTGLFVENHTDLVVPDTVPIHLTRTYRQLDDQVRPFGVGANHLYGIFLHTPDRNREANLILPDSGRVKFARINPNVSIYQGFFRAVGTTGPFRDATIHWNGHGWDLTRTDGMVYVFGEEAPLQAIRDRHGNQVTVSRTNGQSGNVTRVTSPNGRWIRFGYTGNLVAEAADNAGHTVHYGYDNRNRLTQVTSPGGQVTRYAYTDQHAMTTITDPRGIAYLTNTYDGAGRVASQRLADGSTVRFDYTVDGSGRVTATTVTDAGGRVARVAFDANGRTGAQTVALGTPLERTSTVERDPATFDVLRASDPYGRQTAFTYDGRGNLTSVTELAGTPSARTSHVAYGGPFNLPTAVTDPLGHVTRFDYDASGNLVSSTDAEDRTTRWSYNRAGQVVSWTDPLGNVTTYTYDGGSLLATTDPLGRTGRRVVDALGRTTSTIDATGAASRIDYDADGRVSATTDPLGHTTTFGYDGNARPIRVTDARGNATTFTYDTSDRVATATDPLGRVTTYGYDALDRLTSTTDRRGVTTRFAYDDLDRPTSVRHGATDTGQESTVGYGYDAFDRLSELADTAGGTITYQYDAFDRVTRENGPHGTLDHGYDAADRRTAMTVSGQPTVTYGYDASGLLTSLTQGPATVTWRRDGAGRVTGIDRPGVRAAYTYDGAWQLTAITYTTPGGGEIGALQYTHDPNGRIASVSGNLAQVTIPATGPPVRHDAANRLVEVGGQALSYDEEGNLTGDGTRAYTWNARGELTGVTGAGQDTTFGYDPRGRRTSTTVAGATTTYLYDGPNLVQENTPGGTATRLTGGFDQTLRRSDADGARMPITDHLGTVLGLVDESGALTTRYRYDPYGAVTATGAGNGNTQQYTGRESDTGTGLLYNRARYYSPGLGRFISEDPIGFGGGTTNLYNYAYSDPTNLSDPTGQFPWALVAGCALGVGIGLLGNGRKYTWGEALRDCALGVLGGIGTKLLARGLGRLLARPFKVPARYNRPPRATQTPAAEQARRAGIGQPCPTCQTPMQPGTPTAPTAQHHPELWEKWYRDGPWDPADFERYAKSAESLGGAACRACQSAEGNAAKEAVRWIEEAIKRYGWARE